MTLPADLVAEADWARFWLIDHAWPIWARYGVDRRDGGFFDRLDPVTLRDAAGFKRLRVAARQTYVFSQAVLSGWEPGLPLVRHGLDFLFRRARRADGGYAVRFDLHGTVTDDTRDLYDSAFVLFALAYAYRATGDGTLVDAALDLLRFIETAFAHKQGGFAEGLPPCQPRRQNPHMHLFEATLAWTEIGAHDAFPRLAQRLFDLFLRYFIGTGPEPCLREYYADDWRPWTAAEGQVVEPGHHFEWAWLLWQWHRRSGQGLDEAAALYRVTERQGISAATGTAVDELRPDGSVKAAGSRLWPQAERLKAAVAMAEAGRADPAAVIAASRQLRRYLAAPTPGLWYERLSADGNWSNEAVPASSLYHIVLALSELIRFAGDRP